ncbi:MAG: dockerin type I repeat-containing protein [Clostridia bacterium]|nr:dockerin type I repeat-containing protein [Clostridia bacterium]
MDAVRPDNTTNGVVVLLTFRVKEGVPVGNTAITLSYNADDVYDQNFENVGFRVENGTVEIVEYTPGDVNGDGKINNKDLGLLQQYLNGWMVTVSEKGADANGDGKVNNKDLGLLQQYLNGWNVELG